jgi:hypothetical protein
LKIETVTFQQQGTQKSESQKTESQKSEFQKSEFQKTESQKTESQKPESQKPSLKIENDEQQILDRGASSEPLSTRRNQGKQIYF